MGITCTRRDYSDDARFVSAARDVSRRIGNSIRKICSLLCDSAQLPSLFYVLADAGTETDYFGEVDQ